VTEIKTIGPIRELVPEWADPDTGDLYPEHWAQVILAEAVGTDGTVYMRSLTAGEAILDYPAFVENLKASAAKSLERDMRNKGVWSE
jgi:hypothetical protein